MRKMASDRRAEVKVDLTIGERTIDPIDEGFDVAGSRRRPIPVLIVRSLATWRRVLCCSPAYFETLGPFAAIVRTRRP
jgi:DNA-binding transcriptional LysR family regulator